MRLYTESIQLKGWCSAVELDLVLMYKLLSIIRQREPVSASELQKMCNASFSTISKYITIMEQIGLITVEGARPKRIRITKKGIDYLFLLGSVERLLGIRLV